jgi:ABC-type branched-subunit amino acid transport system ATPase component
VSDSVDLDVQGVTVRFGGIVAVSDATVYARGGEITGLIGPNGAGKTTFFNACSGRNRPERGTVALGGRLLETTRRTEDALSRCGIAALAGKTVGGLSTGQRRLVELARAVATPFTFLLLDEPSSGLDVAETKAFGEVLTNYVAETGHGILIVEHDMALVADICARIYVLDFGKVIYEGTTAEALRSDTVKAAYLGDVAIA